MKLSKYLILAGLLLVFANVANASSYEHDADEQTVESVENDYLRTVSGSHHEGRHHRKERHHEGRPHRERQHHGERRRHRQHNENHHNRNRSL